MLPVNNFVDYFYNKLKASVPYPKMYLYRRLVQAKLFIDEHYTENINLEQIADEACFSRFHFIRLFKNIFGKTPHQYLIQVRLIHSKKLFENGRSITDVCFELGFESPTTFAGLFKKHYGMTIGQFISKHSQRQQAIQEKPLYFIPGCHALPH